MLGHVVGLVMLEPFFVPTGQSFVEHVGGKPSQWWMLRPESGFAHIQLHPASIFYRDLSSDELEDWVKKLQTRQSL